VAKVKRKHVYKRGYSVALLVGFEEDHAILWQIFSHVVKPHLTLELGGKRTDERVLYNFHEAVIDALRPLLKEGLTSVVVTAPAKTPYAADFLDHVRKHHNYLIQPKGRNTATFAHIVGSADQPHKVAELVKTREFHRVIAETTSGEVDHVVDALEKHLYGTANNLNVLFSLKEIEDMIYDKWGNSGLSTMYLMLTDKYLADSGDKNRINRLLQISKNKKVKTRIVEAETPAGERISQFGGMVFFTVPDK
jgi:stalled ribosome rescue protein Dom34